MSKFGGQATTPNWKNSADDIREVLNSERCAQLSENKRGVIEIFHNVAHSEHFEIVSGNSNLELAKKVAEQLKVPLSPVMCDRFNDGECNIKLGESVRNTHVFVVQSTCPGRTSNRTINDHLMELFLLVRCMRRASARKVTAVIPYYGYARQDEKVRPRVPIAASDVAMLLESAGVDRILAVDLHSSQIQGQFHHAPVDNLSMFDDFAEFFVTHILSKYTEMEEFCIVSPDANGTARAKFFLGLLQERGVENVSLAITIRQKQGNNISVNIIGEIQDKHCVIVDDIIDTAGRITTASETLLELGGKSVGVFASHGVFSGKALLKIEASDIEYVVVSDSIPLPNGKITKKLRQVSCAALISEAIASTLTGSTVEHLYGFKSE